MEETQDDENDYSVLARDAVQPCIREAVANESPVLDEALTRNCLLDAFRKLDKTKSGIVDRHVFLQILRAVLSCWADADLETLLAASGAIPVDGEPASAGVQYEVFADWFFVLSAKSSAVGEQAVRSSAVGQNQVGQNQVGRSHVGQSSMNQRAQVGDAYRESNPETQKAGAAQQPGRPLSRPLTKSSWMPRMQGLQQQGAKMLDMASAQACTAMTAVLSAPAALASAMVAHFGMMIGVLLPEAEVEEKAQQYTKMVEEMWRNKKGNVAEELLANCRMGRRGRCENLDKDFLCVQCIELGEMHQDKFDDYRITKATLGLLSLFIYTMQDVDVDRLFLFQDCPATLSGADAHPEARDKAYKAYREVLKKKKETRNAMIFKDGCWSARAYWDAYASGKPNLDAEATLEKWVKWVMLITALRQKLDIGPVTRGLTQLPDFLLEQLMEKKPGDHIFWASLSSTTLDASISESYANQCRPACKNVLFTIHGVNEGIPLYAISQYPAEAEVLLPMFTMLRVLSVVPSPDENTPGRLDCQFEGSLMSADFTKACEDDLNASMAMLFGIEALPSITAEQLSLALDNMAAAWETVPVNRRRPVSEALFWYEEDVRGMCKEMSARWSSGRSSHPDRDALAACYPPDDSGLERLVEHVLALRDDPEVQTSAWRLRLAKYPHPQRPDTPTGPALRIARAMETLLRDFDEIDFERLDREELESAFEDGQIGKTLLIPTDDDLQKYAKASLQEERPLRPKTPTLRLPNGERPGSTASPKARAMPGMYLAEGSGGAENLLRELIKLREEEWPDRLEQASQEEFAALCQLLGTPNASDVHHLLRQVAAGG